MKFLSVAFILLGPLLHSVSRYGHYEGAYMRIIGSLMTLGGILYYLEALKNEIIKALSKKTDDNDSNA